MPCHRVQIGDGFAIVCTGRRPAKRCKCGEPATLQCDWKTGAVKRNGKSRTCDAYICAKCAQEVGADKHLCREHQAAYRQWLVQRAAE